MDSVRDTAIWYLRNLLGIEAVTLFQERTRDHSIRDGQAFMNVLFQLAPDDYSRLAGHLFDPFYRDANIPMAVDVLCTKE